LRRPGAPPTAEKKTSPGAPGGDDLFRATTSLDRGLWAQAAAQFDEVQRQHPYSPWAQRAMLMSAYAHYRSRDYEKAISSAQEYISLHPGGDGAPYAYYLLAICQFDQIIDVGRDQARSDLALLALNEVTARFPESDYARDASLKTDMVMDQLAGKEMESGAIISSAMSTRRDQPVQEGRQSYDTTTHVPEALHHLVESCLSIGLKGQAQATAVLGYNFPGSDWYADSYKLVTDAGLDLPQKPENEKGINWIARLKSMF
jgi:outer membrane protein assembly factor BamD